MWNLLVVTKRHPKILVACIANLKLMNDKAQMEFARGESGSLMVAGRWLERFEDVVIVCHLVRESVCFCSDFLQ